MYVARPRPLRALSSLRYTRTARESLRDVLAGYIKLFEQLLQSGTSPNALPAR